MLNHRPPSAAPQAQQLEELTVGGSLDEAGLPIRAWRQWQWQLMGSDGSKWSWIMVPLSNHGG